MAAKDCERVVKKEEGGKCKINYAKYESGIIVREGRKRYIWAQMFALWASLLSFSTTSPINLFVVFFPMSSLKYLVFKLLPIRGIIGRKPFQSMGFLVLIAASHSSGGQVGHHEAPIKRSDNGNCLLLFLMYAKQLSESAIVRIRSRTSSAEQWSATLIPSFHYLEKFERSPRLRTPQCWWSAWSGFIAGRTKSTLWSLEWSVFIFSPFSKVFEKGPVFVSSIPSYLYNISESWPAAANSLWISSNWRGRWSQGSSQLETMACCLRLWAHTSCSRGWWRPHQRHPRLGTVQEESWHRRRPNLRCCIYQYKGQYCQK